MKAGLKCLAQRALTVPPVYAALRARALRQDPVTILCYHTLRPDDDPIDSWLALAIGEFRRQIGLLRRDYDIVSLDAALKPSRGTRPRAVLTFDDGEVGLHRHLLPLVEAEALPVTVYVATRQIETGRPYWFDRVMNALQGEGETGMDLCEHGLGTWQVGPALGKVRWQQIGAVLEALKQVPPGDREVLADVIAAQAGPPAPRITPLAPMSVAQVQDLAASPHVTIGAHSHGHELLDQIPLADAHDSIACSRELLQGWTGQKVRHFAYPNGNHSSSLMAALAEMGFASATILGDRLAHRGAPAQALPRIAVGRYDGLSRFRLRLVGI